jgi:hypothetical protein
MLSLDHVLLIWFQSSTFSIITISISFIHEVCIGALRWHIGGELLGIDHVRSQGLENECDTRLQLV